MLFVFRNFSEKSHPNTPLEPVEVYKWNMRLLKYSMCSTDYQSVIWMLEFHEYECKLLILKLLNADKVSNPNRLFIKNQLTRLRHFQNSMKIGHFYLKTPQTVLQKGFIERSRDSTFLRIPICRFLEYGTRIIFREMCWVSPYDSTRQFEHLFAFCGDMTRPITVTINNSLWPCT